MEIQVGKYVLRSDQYCMWIDEEYMGTDIKGRPKKAYKRVAGYARTAEILLRQFVEHKHKASEADTMTKLIRELKQIVEDTEAINTAMLKEDFKMMSKLKKEIKEINS